MSRRKIFAFLLFSFWFVGVGERLFSLKTFVFSLEVFTFSLTLTHSNKERENSNKKKTCLRWKKKKKRWVDEFDGKFLFVSWTADNYHIWCNFHPFNLLHFNLHLHNFNWLFPLFTRPSNDDFFFLFCVFVRLFFLFFFSKEKCRDFLRPRSRANHIYLLALDDRLNKQTFYLEFSLHEKLRRKTMSFLQWNVENLLAFFNFFAARNI